MAKKVALITGITGQDGAYLAEFLLEKGYEVHRIKRRTSLFNTERIDHLYQDPHEENVRFFLHYGDLTDSLNIVRLIQEIQPDEIYNLAAQSHVWVSFFRECPPNCGNCRMTKSQKGGWTLWQESRRHLSPKKCRPPLRNLSGVL